MRAALLRVLAALLLLPVAATAQTTLRSSEGELKVTPVAIELKFPWAFGFLPDGKIIITERGGRILITDPDDGSRIELSGGPEALVGGQGGLLDVLVPRDFATSRELFFTYSKEQSGWRSAGTAVARAVLSDDGRSLAGLADIYEIKPGSSGGRHFGSRLLEAEDGSLFFTVGDRGDRPSAQDLSRENGSVLRINRDGSIPADNPFAGRDDVLPAIWSYGHRNAQGAAWGLDGELWTVEHGARGGDEVNLIEPGLNYGWPVISYGVHYLGTKIGEGTSKEGMEQPNFYWDPSIAPSGMMVYSGKLWPAWRGHLFVGSLKFSMISRLEDQGSGQLREAERLASPRTARVRDIREAPDGSIWFLSVVEGTLYRLDPAD